MEEVKKEGIWQEKVSLEVAEKEISDWLDFNKVTPLQRENYEETIKVLIEGIQYGMLSLSENKFTQTLLSPTTDLKTLEYKSRITVLDLDQCSKGISPGDAAGKTLAVLQCLTQEAKQKLRLLDKADKRFAYSIVIFFLET